MEYSTGQLLKRFVPYYRPYFPTLIRDLLCAALTTVCELILPMIIRQMTNMGMYHFDQLTIAFILRLALVYFLLRIVDCLANFYMADIGHVMGARIETDMRRDAYGHLQQLSDRFYNNTKVGQIMGRITNDLFDVTEFSHHCPEEFFIAAVKAFVSFILLSRINLLLTVIIFAIIPFMLYVCVRVNRWQRAAFRHQRVQIGELNARIEDSLLGQRVVKAFANEKIEIGKFEKDNLKFLGIKEDTYWYMGIFKTVTLIFEGIMYLTVILAGGLFLYHGRIQPPDLVVYVLYVNMLIATIRRIVEFTEQFQRGMTGIERFLQIMDSDIDIFSHDGAVELKDPKGDICFKDVAFEYSDDHTQVLTHLNLMIHHGEKI
ncbi:MAG: ABC transporter ATP-binding protein, partial [Blautia sp.]|nr:ABC transporter ATP-binding protein [Blautia sp.]